MLTLTLMSSFSHPSLVSQSSRFNRRNSKERIFGQVVSLDAFAKAFANVWKARANFKGQGQANATTRKTRKTLKPVKSRKNILADEGSAHGGKTFHHMDSLSLKKYDAMRSSMTRGKGRPVGVAIACL